MKCLVKDCQNHVGEGSGLFLLIPELGDNGQMKWICLPCWDFLTRVDSVHSQPYRNAEAIARRAKTAGLGN